MVFLVKIMAGRRNGILKKRFKNELLLFCYPVILRILEFFSSPFSGNLHEKSIIPGSSKSLPQPAG